MAHNPHNCLLVARRSHGPVRQAVGHTLPLVATERRVSRAVLVEQLRHAIDQLAMEYEVVAYASVGESEQERRRSALARKPMPRDKGDAPARARARSAGAIAGRGRT
jgi:hypothetical protein